MKSASVATILSVAALGGFGLVYMKLDRLEDRMDTARAGERRTASASRDPFEDGVRRDRPAKPAPKDEPGKHPSTKDKEKEKDAARESDPGETPMTREELDARLRKLEAASFKQRKRRRIRSAAALSKVLKLSRSQRDRVAAVLENGKRRIEEVMKIPDSSGTSPYERRERLRERVRDAFRTGEWGDVKAAMKTPSVERLAIPGRNLTYGEEVARIAGETRTEIAGTLNAQQQQDFEATTIKPVLTGGGFEPRDVLGQAKRDVAAERAEAGDGK